MRANQWTGFYIGNSVVKEFKYAVGLNKWGDKITVKIAVHSAKRVNF